MELVSAQVNRKKVLYDFTEDELQEFPLKCLVKKVSSTELLVAWHKLPVEYTSKFELQTRLPCFMHYNRPEWFNHLDGPPTPQSDCNFCKFAVQKLK